MPAYLRRFFLLYLNSFLQIAGNWLGDFRSLALVLVLTAFPLSYRKVLHLDDMNSSSSNNVSLYTYDVIADPSRTVLKPFSWINDAIDPKSRLSDDELCLDTNANNTQLLTITPHLPEVCKYFSDPMKRPRSFGADFYSFRLPMPSKGCCVRKEMAVPTLKYGQMRSHASTQVSIDILGLATVSCTTSDKAYSFAMQTTHF